MIVFRHSGNFKKIEKTLKKAIGNDYMTTLKHYGERGVRALSSATPKDTGKTASSWSYDIYKKNKNEIRIVWTNSNINDGVNIAIILQYGHGTRNGAYVQGVDYINPAIKPVFDELADSIWKEVTTV